MRSASIHLVSTAGICLAVILAGLDGDPVFAAVRRVPSQYPTIQAGVQAAVNGDTVLVAPGTYAAGNPAIDFAGKRIVLVSEAGASTTIIDVNGPRFAFDFHSGEPPTTVVRGFTVQHGLQLIYCTASSATIIDCVFKETWSAIGEQHGGAAFSIEGSALTFINCDFKNNQISSGNFPAFGGAIVSFGSSLTLIDCRFDNNSTFGLGSAGGAVACYDGSLIISGCSFTNNVATSGGLPPDCHGGSGGALLASNCSGSVTNTVFGGNMATSSSPLCSSYGGGGAVAGGGGSMVFTDCLFENNASGGEAGSIRWFGPSRFEQCTFLSNEARWGGAVKLNGAPTFLACEFSDNVALDVGGAVFFELQGSSNPLFDHCLFMRNSARLGGVLGIGGTTPTLASCTLVENSATDPEGGGAIYLSASGGAIIDRTIISFGAGGGSVYCAGTCCGATVTCSDIFGNAGGDYVDCLSGLSGVNGNISSDPAFCDAANEDYQLDATSPCAPGNSPNGCGLIGALPVGCGVTGVPASDAPMADQRLTINPNPVRGVAHFEIGTGAGHGALRIFDTKGRLVEQLMGQEGHWEWAPGASVPAGVYFAVPGAGLKATDGVKFLYLR